MSKSSRIKAKKARDRKKQQVEEAAEMEEMDSMNEEKMMEDEESMPKGKMKKDYEGPEIIEKMDTMGVMSVGPTSFEELDAMHEAHEIAEKVDEVTWNVRQLVANILYDPASDPKQKSQKIQKVAGEFETRVTQVMGEAMRKDMDVLQIDAILAADARNTGVLEKVGDWINKEVLSTASRKKLSNEDFALPDKRKYPIHDKAHVRNALARAAQMIKQGGDAAEDARKALPKIRAAAKKFGIESGVEKSALIIEKDAKGDWRWIGIPTNNFIDWQNDIISKSAHEKYIAFLDANPDCAPVFLSWHTPGTAREHPVDFWMEKDGAVIMSGILTEDEAAALFTVQKDTDLGMSLQAVAMRLDPDPRVVTDYWMYEVSDLPRDKAANPFTTLETMTKEVGMDKFEYLSKLMGSEERAKAFLERTGQTQKDLQAAGITSKEKPVEETPETLSQAASPESPPPEAVVNVDQIVKQITDQLDIEGLNAFVAQAQEAIEKVPVLEGLVKELSQSKDEQLEKALTPPVSRFAWSTANRPSQSKATELKKDESAEDKKLSELTPGVPDDYWLSKATNTVPIQAP